MGWILVVTGAIGLTASLVLTTEKFILLADPSYRPSCSINPIISCGSIMTSPQAELLGFPNPLLGLIGFTISTTTGVLAAAGVRLPKWYWAGLLGGLTAATALVHWLIFQSLYRIHALCPYCMLVWVVTVIALWYVALHAATTTDLSPRTRKWLAVAGNNHTLAITVWGLVVAAMIAQAFWEYWTTLV